MKIEIPSVGKFRNQATVLSFMLEKLENESSRLGFVDQYTPKTFIFLFKRRIAVLMLVYSALPGYLLFTVFRYKILTVCLP